jgi:phosphohistidine swiveling domain-containing protein
MRRMQRIDSKQAESDLLKLGTIGVRTLGDFLNEELLNFRQTLTNHLEFAKLSQQQRSQLEMLVEKYGFLKCHQVHEAGYTTQELFTMALEADQIIAKSRIDDDELYAKYISSGHMAYIFEQFKYWMNIRNQQMEYLMFAVLRSRPLFAEISQEINLTIKELWSMSREVLLESIRYKNKRYTENFSQANLVIYRENGKTQVTNQLHIIYETKTDSDVIRGKTVYGEGKITGKVKIVFKPSDLTNFTATENTILVTGMTTPDYVPYLKKFVALVTDEGGILCHAAIIAREMQTPAIVGTGVATELLKDEMAIELDLDRGEIVNFLSN